MLGRDLSGRAHGRLRFVEAIQVLQRERAVVQQVEAELGKVGISTDHLQRLVDVRERACVVPAHRIHQPHGLQGVRDGVGLIGDHRLRISLVGALLGRVEIAEIATPEVRQQRPVPGAPDLRDRRIVGRISQRVDRRRCHASPMQHRRQQLPHLRRPVRVCRDCEGLARFRFRVASRPEQHLDERDEQHLSVGVVGRAALQRAFEQVDGDQWRAVGDRDVVVAQPFQHPPVVGGRCGKEVFGDLFDRGAVAGECFGRLPVQSTSHRFRNSVVECLTQ